MTTEHNNRLPPAADKRRALWHRGQRKFTLRAIIFCVFSKSRECVPKIRNFRANGIPVGERGDFFRHAHRRIITLRSLQLRRFLLPSFLQSTRCNIPGDRPSG